ncbi:MAG: hypothetical protein ACI9FU_000006 [Granulosicoccus sp.]|jgi:hypothetical protein
MSTVKITLKNNGKKVVMDTKVQEAIDKDKYLSSINILKNLRGHSNGYAVYQRCITTKKGPVYETIYLHKWIADTYIKKPKSDKKLFVRFINSNVLDSRVENLEWVTMGMLRRHMSNFKSRSGYRGVTKEKNRFRAVIYHDRKAFNLGFYDTAEEAAEAYNKKSIELFGKTGSLNVIKKKKK